MAMDTGIIISRKIHPTDGERYPNKRPQYRNPSRERPTPGKSRQPTKDHRQVRQPRDYPRNQRDNYGVSRDRQHTDPSRRSQKEQRDHRQNTNYYHGQQSNSRDRSPYRPENRRQPTKHNEETQDKHRLPSKMRLQTLINNISKIVGKYLQGARK